MVRLLKFGLIGTMICLSSCATNQTEDSVDPAIEKSSEAASETSINGIALVAYCCDKRGSKICKLPTTYFEGSDCTCERQTTVRGAFNEVYFVPEIKHGLACNK